MSENVKVSSSLIDNTDSGAGGPFFAATQICHLAPKFQILGLLHPRSLLVVSKSPTLIMNTEEPQRGQRPSGYQASRQM
ncbi:hypothetical protein FIBSPDRAFT_852877 [Athelia psychrophila]|uniref:Uncharacterized protein n=1 Tax=Athelia psychrophila TaxID=1759441 RepID=A0A166R8X1_9AGAM|nr:hypothetical protein FIBSPDRAFT_852877 [Fibularhizoctonia sp. CBS 109695]